MMKKLMLSGVVLVASTSIAYAQFYDRGVTRQPNVVNSFAATPSIQGQPSRSVCPHKFKQRIRPGRHVDNPAGYQFGDGSPLNTNIHGQINPFFKGNNGRISCRK